MSGKTYESFSILVNLIISSYIFLIMIKSFSFTTSIINQTQTIAADDWKAIKTLIKSLVSKERETWLEEKAADVSFRTEETNPHEMRFWFV